MTIGSFSSHSINMIQNSIIIIILIIIIIRGLRGFGEDSGRRGGLGIKMQNGSRK